MCQAEGELSLQPTRSPSTRGAEVLVSSAIAHPPFWTPTEGAAPGAQLAQLNLALGNDGAFTPAALQVEGASLRKGEEMDALFALHW